MNEDKKPDSVESIPNVQIKAKGSISIDGSVAGRDIITNILIPATSPVFTAPNELSAPVSDFVGREQEAATLVHALRKGGRGAISGMGGIGKTELALLVAERIRDHYPGAQLAVSLHGTDPIPRDPADLLASCIHRLDEKATNLPERVEDLRGIYLTKLKGKRALILLDNAFNDTQVDPLVPPPGCALLVTSREVITLPGMKRITLEQLSPDEASQLLANAAQRTIAPNVGAEICRLSGYLPLALRAAGGTLNTTGDLDPADYSTQLRDEKTRLERIGKVRDVSVEATLNLSYQQLGKDAARVLRQLAVFPGSFDAMAEEVVCGDQGHAYLSSLVKRSLAFYDKSKRRYRLHDLVRLFADSRLPHHERTASQRRHSTHYKDVLGRAAKLYQQGNESVREGLQLFDTEWANIQAGQAWAAVQKREDKEAAKLCSDYPFVGWACLNLRQHPHKGIEWLKAAYAAACHIKNHRLEGWLLGVMGSAYESLAEYRRAIELKKQSLEIARELGDRRGEGITLGNLGVTYESLGHYRRAIEYLEQDLQITRELGDRRGEGITLGNLGVTCESLGEHRRAIEFHEQQLQIAREVGNRRGKGVAREIGDRLGEAHAHWNTSLTLENLGKRSQAIAEAEEALKIYKQIESPDAENARKALASGGQKAKRAVPSAVGAANVSPARKHLWDNWGVGSSGPT